MSDLLERLDKMSRERRSYALRTLPAHLEATGASSKLHTLLRERVCREHRINKPDRKPKRPSWLLPKRQLVIRVQCENIWYAAQEREGNTSTFIADVARGWRLAEADLRSDIMSGRQGLSTSVAARYALITASINSLGANIQPELLAGLVESTVWTTTQGLAYARQIPLLNQRAMALVAVSKHVMNEHGILKQALATVTEIKDEGKRADAFVNLSTHLPQSLLREAAAAASAIKNDGDRVRVLTQIALYVEEPVRSEMLEQASAGAQTLKREEDRWKALLDLELLRSNPDRQASLERILDRVADSSDVFWQLEMIKRAAKHLSESVLTKAQKVALGIREEPYRTNALLELAVRTAQFGRGDEALQQVEAAGSVPGCGRAQAQALTLVMPYLSQDQMHHAFKLMRRLYSEEDRAEAIAGTGPCLPEDLFRRAVKTAKAMKNVEHLGIAVKGLVERLPGPESEKLLDHVVKGLIQKPVARAILVDLTSKLVPHLSPTLLRLVLSEIRKLNDGLQIIKTIIASATNLPVADKAEVARLVLNETHLLTDERERAEAYAHITALIAETAGVDEAVRIAETIDQPDKRAEALLRILPNLSSNLKNKVPSETLRQWAGDLGPNLEGQMPAGMKLIAPFLSERLLHEALMVARNKRWTSCRGGMLAALAQSAKSLTSLRQVKQAVDEIDDQRVRSTALVNIAEQLAYLGSYAEAVEIVQSTTDLMIRLSAFEKTIRHLPFPFLQQIASLIDEFSFEGSRWSIKAVLAPRLAELGNLSTALEVMLSIGSYHRTRLGCGSHS